VSIVSTSSFFLRVFVRRRLRFKSLQARAANDRRRCAVVALVAEKLADLFLDEVDEVLLIDHVHLVQEDNEFLESHLLCKKDVLARLRHHAVSRGDHEYGAVHLGSTRDHVLNVVRVARRVDVRVVAVRRLVLRVVERDGDAARLLFRCGVDLINLLKAGAVAHAFQHIEHVQDACRERCLAVVNVADGAYVHVRLCAIEFCHGVLVNRVNHE
jgi:hypothetical protein